VQLFASATDAGISSGAQARDGLSSLKRTRPDIDIRHCSTSSSYSGNARRSAIAKHIGMNSRRRQNGRLGNGDAGIGNTVIAVGNGNGISSGRQTGGRRTVLTVAPRIIERRRPAR